jgi:hypothetical protein
LSERIFKNIFLSGSCAIQAPDGGYSGIALAPDVAEKAKNRSLTSLCEKSQKGREMPGDLKQNRPLSALL